MRPVPFGFDAVTSDCTAPVLMSVYCRSTGVLLMPFRLRVVGAAVVFLGESFSRINALGLCVLVAGVALFNYSKYRKIASGRARTGKPSGAASHREDGADGDEEGMRLMPRMGSGAAHAMPAPGAPALHRSLKARKSGRGHVDPKTSIGPGSAVHQIVACRQ